MEYPLQRILGIHEPAAHRDQGLAAWPVGRGGWTVAGLAVCLRPAMGPDCVGLLSLGRPVARASPSMRR